MSTFLERLKEEEQEVRERLENLEIYIYNNPHFGTLSKANRALLEHQRKMMLGYLETLVVRIELNSK